MAADRIKKEFLARVLVGLILLGVPLGFAIWGLKTDQEGLLVQGSIPENGGWNPGTIRAEVGQPLDLLLTSNDVVHGFAVGKIDQPGVDVLPGEVTSTSLVFTEPGRYVYYCTRWCSPDHWRMRGTIIVEGQPQAGRQSDPPLYVELGIDIDQSLSTDILPVGTMSIQAGSALMDRIPTEDLELFRDFNYLLTNSPASAWASIRAEAFAEDMSDQDIWNLVAALWRSGTSLETLKNGEGLYNQNCAACHGITGNGTGIFAQKYSPGEITSSELLGDIAKPADFTDVERMLAANSAIFEGKILRGGMGTGMPNFGPIFSQGEIWSMIDYIWTFQFQE
jgi:mono/diheme cytochrome c family protein/plastocyanin